VDLSVRHTTRRKLELVSIRITRTGMRRFQTYLPDSNQQSKTSSTRLRSPFPCLLGIVM
jgi:hypothetical protein